MIYSIIKSFFHEIVVGYVAKVSIESGHATWEVYFQNKTFKCDMGFTANPFTYYTVRQKIAPFYFCNNFVRLHCILIIFGKQILK